MNPIPPCWATELDAWTTWLRAGERHPSTIKLRCYHLGRLIATIGAAAPAEVTEDQLALFLANPTWAPSTRRSYRSSIGQFYRWLHTHGRSPSNPADLLLPMPLRQTVPRPAPDDVILQALHDATPRVRVMLLLGSEAGLRRAEIAAVRRSDITATARTGKLHITGKGRRQRIVPLTDRLIAELDMYPAAGAGQWLFPSPRRSGPIGAVRVGELLSDALPAPWTAHSLRHRFATVAYANSHDLLLVQHLMGHSKPETTAAYVQLDTTAARAVVSRGALVA